MAKAEIDYGETKHNPPRSTLFFKIFYRMKFALKESRYLIPPRNNEETHRAEAHWDDFANDLGAKFFEDLRDGG